MRAAAELQNQGNKLKLLEQKVRSLPSNPSSLSLSLSCGRPSPGRVAWQGSKQATPRVGGTEHLQVRLEQLEGRSLGANSLVTSLQQQFQQLQQQQQQASSTVKSVAEAAQLAQKALLAEAAAQKPPATDDTANTELRARLESLESSAKRTQTVASQQAADMKLRGVLRVPSCWCHSSLPWLTRADYLGSWLRYALGTGR
jgi:hypothetical protein